MVCSRLTARLVVAVARAFVRQLPVASPPTAAKSDAGKKSVWSWSRYRYRTKYTSKVWPQTLRCNGGIHVALDFSNAQRPVVDSYLVYCSRKILTLDTVTADLQSIRRDRDWPSLRTAHLRVVRVRA